MRDCQHTNEGGIEIWGLYDGILVWSCNDCRRLRHRWAPGTRQHRQAVEWAAKGGLVVEPYTGVEP